MKTVNELKKTIESINPTSAWHKGVKAYAIEMLDNLDGEKMFSGSPADKKLLLNGASNWQQYSESGCSLVYDGDIACRLCTPSQWKRSEKGTLAPNQYQTWIDIQTRALYQAYNLICKSV